MATEATVQTAVWQIELGRGRRVVLWVLVVLLALSLSLIYTALQFRGLEKREAMDMAQVARNIARGHGFTTYVIRPLSLWQLKEHAPDHEARPLEHPDLYNPPLYPVMLAGLFKLLPDSVFGFGTIDRVYAPERWVILPFNQICLLLSVLLVYLWAKRLFDARIAFTAGLLLLFSDTLWAYGISGLPSNLLMLLVLLMLYCLWQVDRRLNPPPGAETEAGPRPVDAVAIGLLVASAVLAGLCFLTRYTAGLLVLPVSIYLGLILRGRRGGVWVLVYAVVFLAVVTPWLIRNARVAGNPLGIAAYQMIGDEVLQREYHPNVEDAFTFRLVARQLVTGTKTYFLDALRRISTDYLVCFFLVGVMYGFRRRDVARLRGLVLGLLVAGIVSMALFGVAHERIGGEIFGGNLLVLLVPLVAVFGVAFFYLLLDRISFQNRLTQAAAIGVFALVNVAPMIYSFLPPRRALFPYPPYIAPYTALAAHWFGPDEVGASDLPWALAWVGDRRTVWLPMEVNDFVDINDFVLPKGTKGISSVLLTPYMLDRNFQSELLKGEFKNWSSVVRGQVPTNFPLRAVTLFPPGNDQILFADRPRWLSTAPAAAAESTKPKAEPAPATNAPPAAPAH